MKDIALRTVFDEEAQLYHEIRPHYPEALFNALTQTIKLPPNAEVLEIGPGTGQATVLMAMRGYNITAIELGANMLAVARKDLKQYPNVKILQGSFEDTNLPENTFDLVYAATAFHWVKPEYRFSKTHRILKSVGYLAIIHTEHMSDSAGDEFVLASQPIYNRFFSQDELSFRLPRADEIKPWKVDENLFTPILFKLFPLSISYTANEYTKLLSTYSPNRALRPEIREKFLESIAELINDQFGGRITKHFAMTLNLATKKV